MNPILNDDLYLGKRLPDIGQAIYLHSFALKISSQAIIEKVFKLTTPDLENDKGMIRTVDG